MRCELLKTIFMLAATGLAAQDIHAASFDCLRASTPIERLICTDNSLGKLDESVAVNYRRLLGTLTVPEVDALRTDQKRWLKYRETACGLDLGPKGLDPLPNYAPCVRELYQERIGVLESRDSLTAFLSRRLNPLFHPNNTDLRRTQLAHLSSTYSMQIDADNDSSCRSMAAAFPSQNGIEHISPIIVASDYEAVVARAQLDLCTNVELKTWRRHESYSGRSQSYVFPPTFALFEIDNAQKIYIFLDQGFHMEQSRAEGIRYVGEANYQSVNAALCKTPEKLGLDHVNCGGNGYDSMHDFYNRDPINCEHGLIRFEGKVFKYGVLKIDQKYPRDYAYHISLDKLEESDVPGFRYACGFKLREPSVKKNP